MRYRRSDIVERAVGILDQWGLPDLSMRRIASELGLQPSALYHHFESKQVLLAAVADELLLRGARPDAPDCSWDDRIIAQSRELRDAMLAYRDGAELVATVHAFGLGAHTPLERLIDTLRAAGFEADFSQAAASTVMHYVFGSVAAEQTHQQANSMGAIDSDPGDHTAFGGGEGFDVGLGLILDGIRLRAPAPDHASTGR